MCHARSNVAVPVNDDGVMQLRRCVDPELNGSAFVFAAVITERAGVRAWGRIDSVRTVARDEPRRCCVWYLTVPRCHSMIR